MASSGKKMPLDPEPNAEKGNVAIIEGGEYDGKGTIITGPLLQQARDNGDTLYTSHFFTCPYAAKHRKGR